MNIDDIDKEEFEELYKTTTLAKMQEYYGVPDSTISNWRKKLNIPQKEY